MPFRIIATAVDRIDESLSVDLMGYYNAERNTPDRQAFERYVGGDRRDATVYATKEEAEAVIATLPTVAETLEIQYAAIPCGGAISE